MTVNIPVISENEYHLFRSIGVVSEFPEDFVSFVNIMAKKNNEICHGGIIPVNVNVDFAGFREWFIGSGHKRRKYATYQDLLKYAAIYPNK